MEHAPRFHVLEHVPQQRVLDTLKGVFRILKPGGRFCVSVPDLDILCHTFINPSASRTVKFHVMRMMFGGQVDQHDFHYFGWNQLFLFDILRQVRIPVMVTAESGIVTAFVNSKGCAVLSID